MQRKLMGEEFQGGGDELSQNCQEDMKWVMRDVAWIWQSWWEWFLGGGGGQITYTLIGAKRGQRVGQ